MIFRDNYTMMDDDFNIMPIMAIDDERPLPRRDYYIETEEPIKPYEPTPVVLTKPVVMPPIKPYEPTPVVVTKPVVMPRPVVLEDVIVPIKPVAEFNPVVNKNTGVTDMVRVTKPVVLPKPKPEPKPEPKQEPQPAKSKSINPLYIAGVIVAIILIYKILK